MAVTPPTPGTPTLDPTDIQGNLVGFNKDHQRLVFVGFPSEASGKTFLQALVPDVATGDDVVKFNALFKQVLTRGGAEGTVEATWLNVGLTAAGLTTISAAGANTMPGEFTQGMAAQATALGDVDDSAPAGWLPPFNQGAAPVHAMIIIASDFPDDLQAAYTRLQAKIASTHVTELGHQDGNARPGAERGHEHLGSRTASPSPASTV